MGGARTEFTPGIVGLAVAYVLLRAVGKLAGSMATERGATLPCRRGVAPRLLSPGILGVAFALNALRTGSPDMTVVLLGRGARHHRRVSFLPARGCRRISHEAASARSPSLAAAVLWVRHASAADPVGSAGTALALGFTLLGASSRATPPGALRLPRLTGYLLFGVLVGPYLGNVITEAMAASFRPSPASRRR